MQLCQAADLPLPKNGESPGIKNYLDANPFIWTRNPNTARLFGREPIYLDAKSKYRPFIWTRTRLFGREIQILPVYLDANPFIWTRTHLFGREIQINLSIDLFPFFHPHFSGKSRVRFIRFPAHLTKRLGFFPPSARDGHFPSVECNSASVDGEQKMKRVKELFHDIKWFAVALYALAFIREGGAA